MPPGIFFPPAFPDKGRHDANHRFCCLKILIVDRRTFHMLGIFGLLTPKRRMADNSQPGFPARRGSRIANPKAERPDIVVLDVSLPRYVRG